MSTPTISLHVWPSRWNLPSYDPPCLAAIIYLQLAIPGKFRVIECRNPDESPTGQLPFLSHEQHLVASYPSIVKYIAGLRNVDHSTYPNANLDIHLSRSEKSQSTAWSAHAESQLGDLVYHSMYAIEENWSNMTGPALASMFPVPQKYYLPQRIRVSHYPRLTAAGLWNTPIEEKPAEPAFKRDATPAISTREALLDNVTLKKRFNREKTIEKSRLVLDLYKEIIPGSYLFHDRLSSSDIIIAAHLILLYKLPYPEPVIKELLSESYPSLISYAGGIYDTAFGEGNLPLQLTSDTWSLWSLLPSKPKQKTHSPTDATNLQEEQQFNRMRWSFFGAVAISLVSYIVIVANQYEEVLQDIVSQYSRTTKSQEEEQMQENDDDVA
ncbi:hypothetical protein CVT24_005919 [Panaeolus cyanescens]|uniref:Mitochondrial outer membrane transport complex Sam37/metaxin N-terminal domain-containing protein n=1 Tax=Panaeolus cyanescens TaxID=181874 RepID=A0A409V8X3_9AGAR|nr:hypothetical protein CVT24_005919 [Panaeolus cyanescens]